MTKRLNVGGVALGGGAEISIQSMCNTRTEDVEATVSQIHRLEQAGCEIVRVTVPTMEAAQAIIAIREQIISPLWRIFILTTALPLRQRNGVWIRSVSTPATSAAKRM